MSAQRALAGVLEGFLGGLLGIGGAVHAGRRTLRAGDTLVLHRAMGLVAATAAWMLRTKVVPLDVLALHMDMVITLLTGSLGGAWCAVEKAKGNTRRFLDRVILVILPAFALVMLAQAMLDDSELARLSASAAQGVTAAVLAGFCIGFATIASGSAGSVLLVPAIVVLFGIDSKIAGSLALTVMVPTMLMGLRQCSGAELLQLFHAERRACLLTGCTTFTGAALGAVLLAMMTPLLILKAMLIVIFYAALMQFIAFFTKFLRAKRYDSSSRS